MPVYHATEADKYAVMIGRTLFAKGEANAVDARELHAKLGSKQQFADWIKIRIAECRFKEGQEYVSFQKIMKREVGASVRTDYLLSLDAAKHFALMERTEVGFKIRQFFIDFENKISAAITSGQLVVIPDFTDPVAAARAWADQYEQRLAVAQEKKTLEAKVQEDAPKVRKYHQFLDSEGTASLRTAAKYLGIGPIKLNARLRDAGILFYENDVNTPKQHIDNGYFVMKPALK